MQKLKYKFAQSPSKIILSFAGFLLILNLAVAVPVFAASPCDAKTPTSTSLRNCLKDNAIIKDIHTIVNFLSAGVGIVIVGSIIVGGIQYAAAGNNPNAVGAAKKRIQDTLIALLAFFFVVAFLQWIIPGGLLEGII